MSGQKRTHLISSVTALRILATGITALSLGGMSVYASDHLYDTAAPLQPTVAQSVPTPAATRTTRTTTGRIQLSAGVPTTTAAPVTKTHRS